MQLFALDSSFFSIDIETTKITATESELHRIFDAAFRGLTGDALALVSGFDPQKFAILLESDPIAAKAVQYGSAMNEALISGAINKDAIEGNNTKAQIFVLTHKHGWKPARPDGEGSNDIRIIVENALPEPKTTE